MTAHINTVLLQGILARDPIINDYSWGACATLRVVTERHTTDKDGNHKTYRNWHRVIVKNADLITIVKNKISKNSSVFIQGELTYRGYEDKDGTKKFTTEIVALILKENSFGTTDSTEIEECQF